MAKIKDSNNSKFCSGYREIRSLIRCWWECKLVQPFEKTVWQYLKKLNTELSSDLALHSCSFIPKKWRLTVTKNLYTNVHVIYKCVLLIPIHLFSTPCTVNGQAPLSMGISRQEYWSALPLPTPKKGEGNGNPLQYSCLENPRDGRAWWAATSGVAQSRTRLKQLGHHHSKKCV